MHQMKTGFIVVQPPEKVWVGFSWQICFWFNKPARVCSLTTTFQNQSSWCKINPPCSASPAIASNSQAARRPAAATQIPPDIRSREMAHLSISIVYIPTWYFKMTISLSPLTGTGLNPQASSTSSKKNLAALGFRPTVQVKNLRQSVSTWVAPSRNMESHRNSCIHRR